VGTGPSCSLGGGRACRSSMLASSSQTPKVPFANSTDTRADAAAAPAAAPGASRARPSAAGGANRMRRTAPCASAHLDR